MNNKEIRFSKQGVWHEHYNIIIMTYTFIVFHTCEIESSRFNDQEIPSQLNKRFTVLMFTESNKKFINQNII